MSLSRRRFMQLAGGSSLLALTGCSRIPSDWYITTPQVSIPDHCIASEESAKTPISHVLDRITYGGRPGDYGYVLNRGVEQYIEDQLLHDSIEDSFCDSMIRRYQTIAYPAGELFEYREDLLWNDLSATTMLRAVYSERQLYERMVGFWTDHFNIDRSKGECPWLKTADDREVIRKHAMGKFPEMLRASALSPAMLWYLDGRENKKMHPEERPNENYAREILELHTLGVQGGYTQQDVMEVARCLTGWHVRSEETFGKGRVEFIAEHHDDEAKIVLGNSIPSGLGEKDLDRVLGIVCAHPSTAQYIATKLCKRFISDEPDTSAIAAVASAYTLSNGDIKTMLRALFESNAFWASSDQKLKRPMHFVASALRATSAQTNASPELLDYLMRMGQAPFSYPTPDGYPDQAEPWLGTLMWRWHFSVALQQNHIPGTSIDWTALKESYGGELPMSAGLLGRLPSHEEKEAVLASGMGPACLLASPSFQRC